MSALLLTIAPVQPAGRAMPHRLQMVLAAVAGAVAPWLLLVTIYGGLARSAASCFAGTMPI